MKSKSTLPLAFFSSLSISTHSAIAQTYTPSNRIPISDNTLNTQVSNNGNNFNITGGLNKGQTLFHSFTDFSIPTNSTVNFSNPASNKSMITRVTGNNFSDLNGILNSNGANFLLINPNGVVFGPNVQLNVGKSFMATTADSIDLVDGGGGRYNFGTRNGNDTPLISINPNVFFNVSKFNVVNGNNSGIVNYGNLAPNNSSQYIGLIGGNVNFIGGKVTAPGGRVDIGGIKTTGEVGITNNGLVLTGNGLVRSDVSMSNGGYVTVRATNTLNSVDPAFTPNATSNGSSINISANNINLVNAGTTTSSTEPAALDAGLETNSGVKTNPSGDIKLNATGLISLDQSGIKNTLRSGAEGKIGDIKIDSNGLNLQNNSIISTTIAGTGSGGNIDIKSNGDINISSTSNTSTAPITLDSPLSFITSSTQGRGDAGKVNISTNGKLAILNGGSVSSSVIKDAVGNSQGVNISARDIEIRNKGDISSDTSGQGNAGNIDIKATGNIEVIGSNSPNLQNLISGEISEISSQTNGQGNAGKITIDAKGRLSLINQGRIRNIVSENGVGDAQDLTLNVGSLELGNSIISSSSFGLGNSGNLTIRTNTGGINLSNGSIVSSSNQGKGNAGDIKINSVGDILIAGGGILNSDPQRGASSFISSATSGQGNAGKIEISTPGKLSLFNRANISSTVGQNAIGNSQGISISAREIELRDQGLILSNTFGKGDAGAIDIKTTGNITIIGYTKTDSQSLEKTFSGIQSSAQGQGDAGKIEINTQGRISLANGGIIISTITPSAIGNGKNIVIAARAVDIRNGSQIASSNLGGVGNAANIDIKTTGDISIAGSTSGAVTSNSEVSAIRTGTAGQGDAGAISIDAKGKLSLSNRALIDSGVTQTGVGKGNNIKIAARDLDLRNSFISSITRSNGNAGDINIKVIRNISLSSTAGITTSSSNGQGRAGNLNIDTKGKLTISNQGVIASNSTGSRGGDLFINVGEYLLLRNQSDIITNSDSKSATDNGGNITINSPLIIATPGNSNITANANAGNGGRVEITSQGLFGIQYRPNGINSTLTNDITASSTFGQSGAVNIDTPGIDPGRDSTELPNVTTDASNQISQVCSANNRENKLTVTGRGGLPPNANDVLTSDVVWQDNRVTTSQSAVSSAPTPAKFIPPAVGMVFDGKGKVTLLAAGTPRQAGTSVACP
jgi:filamentous hemagglutinin family protein